MLYEEYNNELFQEIKEITPIHKLTYKIKKELLSEKCFFNELSKNT